jgi:peroxiredoxin Q/BCP
MITPGTKLPAFALPDQDGTLRRPKDFHGAWWVLYTYPKDLTAGCTTEALDFTALHDDFAALGASVVGLSPDPPKRHLAFITKKELRLVLLADEDHAFLETLGCWGRKKFMGREYDGVIRSTFLINPLGKVVEVWSPVAVSGHAAAVLQKLQELA